MDNRSSSMTAAIANSLGSAELYQYDLPATLIAQTPLSIRDQSRMLYMQRGQQPCCDHQFTELTDLLPEKSVLVFNDTQVLPHKLSTLLPNGAKIECVLIEEKEPGLWRALVKNGRRLKSKLRIEFGDGAILATAVERCENGDWWLQFDSPKTLAKQLQQIGTLPFPPYIKHKQSKATEQNYYQTCYAAHAGAIAAPTAGLHFTPRILNQLRTKGHTLTFVTLHVGEGTFAALRDNSIPSVLSQEWCRLTPATARLLLQSKRAQRAIIAVGTTTTRTLESWHQQGHPPWGYSGHTELFIRPPHHFGLIDGLITNFHLPNSTLLMLISAFHGKDATLHAYQHAIARRYRFYSYGDCMCIFPDACQKETLHAH